MTVMFHEWLGSEPALYAKKIIIECGLNGPPFCERIIADYLKISICELSPDDIEKYRLLSPNFPSMEAFIKESGTYMETNDEGKRVIYTPESVSAGRKRMNIFHECGHAILPWHEQYCYLCKDRDMDPDVRKKIEREAFLCAAEFMMPRAYFVQDILELQSMSIATIHILSKRYHASLEATANWFAFTHPGICSVLKIEPTNLDAPEHVEIEVIPAQQKNLKVGAPFIFHKKVEPEGAPLKVKYAMRSRRFPDRIRPNTAIAAGSPIHQAWLKKEIVRGEIPSSTFGFLDKAPLQFECLPLGYRDKVLVLLWEEDGQKRLQDSGRELLP